MNISKIGNSLTIEKGLIKFKVYPAEEVYGRNMNYLSKLVLYRIVEGESIPISLGVFEDLSCIKNYIEENFN